MSLRQKHIQCLARSVGVTEEKQFLRHNVNAPVACDAERDEVIHRVVLRIPRNAFAQAVNVVDAEPLGCPALAAGEFVASHNGFFIAAERSLVVEALSGALGVFLAQRVAHVGFVGLHSVRFQLARLATLLRARRERVGQTAVNARANSTPHHSARLAPIFLHLADVQFSARDRAARKAKALNRAGRLKARVAPLANALHVAAARHAPRLHLARSAALKISARRLNRDAAIGALNRLVFRDCSHEQNVVGAFPNG